MNCLGRATFTVHPISVQNSQEGIESDKAKKQLSAQSSYMLRSEKVTKFWKISTLVLTATT